MYCLKQLSVVGIVFFFLFSGIEASAQKQPKKTAPIISKIALAKTHKLLVAAVVAVKKGQLGKVQLRKGVVHQRAARWAYRHERLPLATFLTLKARKFARDVIKLNKEKLAKKLETDDPKEIEAAVGSSEKEAAQAVSDAEKSAPSEDDIVKDDKNAGDEEE
jgi:hypothetical protein